MPEGPEDREQHKKRICLAKKFCYATKCWKAKNITFEIVAIELWTKNVLKLSRKGYVNVTERLKLFRKGYVNVTENIDGESLKILFAHASWCLEFECLRGLSTNIKKNRKLPWFGIGKKKVTLKMVQNFILSIGSCSGMYLGGQSTLFEDKKIEIMTFWVLLKQNENIHFLKFGENLKFRLVGKLTGIWLEK